MKLRNSRFKSKFELIAKTIITFQFNDELCNQIIYQTLYELTKILRWKINSNINQIYSFERKIYET